MSRLLAVVVLLAGCRSAGVQGGVLHLQDGRYEEAEAQLRAAVAENPGDPEAHLLLGIALAEQGKAAEADGAFARAADLGEATRRRAMDERTRFARRYQQDALSLLGENRRAEARESLASADAMLPGLSRTLWIRGRLEAAEGRGDAALALYREAAGLDSADREIRADFLAAIVAAAGRDDDAGRIEEALTALAEALAVEPRPDLLRRQGALAYRLAERREGAEREKWLTLSAEAFRAVLRDAPGDPGVAYNLGAVLLAAERHAEAVGVYRSLLAQNPRDGEVYLALALAHRGTGETLLAAAEEAAGCALDARDPVADAPAWARRAAERFPVADVAAAYAEFGAPDMVDTCLEGGGLIETWYYGTAKRIVSFREGRRIGEILRLP